MERKLYVTSKALKSGTRLIGILSENGGKYKFEYKLGDYIPEWFLLLKDFPNISVEYTGKEVENFISRFVPDKDDKHLQGLLESANLKEYDVWEMLKAFGPRNKRDDAFIHETLPEGVIIYEPI